MPKVLYIDACGGVSGDMLAGALLDLGWPLAELEALVSRMDLEGVELSCLPAEHQGLAARRLEVKVAQPQPHRHLSHILSMLERLPERVAEPADRVFKRLAQAEARVHGTTPEEVHFHEVGGCDAVVDVTAFCAGLAWTGAQRVVCSPLPLGRGFVDCAHGRLPLPAPAVLNLLEGAPTTPWPGDQETVTPTGAAIVTALADEFGGLPAMRLEKTGVGGGSRASGPAPNVVRLLLGSEGLSAGGDRVTEIVCHLDDQSPEDLPMVIERLLAAGALDVAAAPLIMKKGRPGLMLIILCPPEKADELAELALEQTTTLGVRLRSVRRRTLEREVIVAPSPWGEVRVKRTRVGAGFRLHPEADDVARIAAQTGLAPHHVRQKILEEIE